MWRLRFVELLQDQQRAGKSIFRLMGSATRHTQTLPPSATPALFAVVRWSPEQAESR